VPGNRVRSEGSLGFIAIRREDRLPNPLLNSAMGTHRLGGSTDEVNGRSLFFRFVKAVCARTKKSRRKPL